MTYLSCARCKKLKRTCLDCETDERSAIFTGRRLRLQALAEACIPIGNREAPKRVMESFK